MKLGVSSHLFIPTASAANSCAVRRCARARRGRGAARGERKERNRRLERHRDARTGQLVRTCDANTPARPPKQNSRRRRRKNNYGPCLDSHKGTLLTSKLWKKVVKARTRSAAAAPSPPLAAAAAQAGRSLGRCCPFHGGTDTEDHRHLLAS